MVNIYLSSYVPQTLREYTVTAMQVWFSAQRWFNEAYLRGEGVPYLLHLSDSQADSDISVTFYVQEGSNIAGVAVISGTNLSPRAEVRINAPPKVVGDPSYRLMLEAVIMHEFGHALGLGHSLNKEDLMYSSVDQNPPSYSLPSTLDLYALWTLSSGKIEREVGLPSSIPYALPPWVTKEPSGALILSIPGYSLVLPYEIWVEYPKPVIRGNQVTVQAVIGNVGAYPFMIIDVSLRLPWFGSRVPQETLPILLWPDRRTTLTWAVDLPKSLQLGEYSGSIEYRIVAPGHDGWRGRGQETKPFNLVVEEPAVVVPTVTTMTLATQVSSVGWFWPIGILFASLLLVCLIHRERRVAKRAAKASYQPTPVIMYTPSKMFCRYCGVEIPRDSVFCEACGKRLHSH